MQCFNQCAFLSRTDAALAKAGVHSHYKHKAGKSKRMRTSFTNEQLSRLEKEFARQQYMVGSERFLLASALQLTEAQVNTQFSLTSGISSTLQDVLNQRSLLAAGQSLVPEQTHQVEETESGAATGQTSQTGNRRAAKKPRISGQRGRGERLHRGL